MSEKERKATQREREQAIANGTYQKSPFEQAKEFLAAQPTLDITTLNNNEELSALLTDENRKQLSNFINNLKQKRKKEKDELAQRQEQEFSYEEKGKYFVAQKTNELQ